MTDRELWIAVFQQALERLLNAEWLLLAKDVSIARRRAVATADLAVKRCPKAEPFKPEASG